MTDLTSFQVTDNVTDNLASYHNRLLGMGYRAEFSNTETISGTKTLTDSDCQFQFLTASGGNQNVLLPPEATTNHLHIIFNAGSSNSLVVLDDSSTYTFATLAPGEYAICEGFNAQSWRVLLQRATENYKFSVTVASNNITLAIKHLDGTDPTVFRPIMIIINGTRRYITAALSVTKNAGTDWMAMGSTLPANETDLFVYAIWNTTPATDIMDLGFSRIPWGSVYSDFSGTSTAYNYLASANASAPTATDDVVNIGRFAATLSAGASYNWSVPTFTSVNLKQKPTYETRMLTWTPTQTRSGGAYTNAPSITASVYAVIGSSMVFHMHYTQNATPGSSGDAQFTVPFSNPYGGRQLYIGNNVTGNTSMNAYQGSATTTVTVKKYDGTTEVTASNVYVVDGTLRLL